MPAPNIPGYALVWSDEFDGPNGGAVDRAKWHLKTGANSNHELQEYTDSNNNAMLSGDGRLFIIPKKDAGGHWTSGRLEGTHGVACDPNHTMIFQSEIRLGNNPADQQRGIWPAFWALGNAVRSGVPWPKCGEWDILEQVNASTANLGTLHFQNSGGVHQMMSGQVGFNRAEYNTWALKVDRTANAFQNEKLTWLLNGHVYFEITGATVGTWEQWEDVAHKAFFPLLNVAVGGDFPGNPDGQTRDGLESGLEAKYVAIYKSNT